MSLVVEIASLFACSGDSQYGGEAVSQREHALQCALLAEQNDASPALITASLLHDIGHLLHDLPADSPDKGIDDHHENSGYHFLRQRFNSDVSEPVRLHVAAKRYLCTVDENYESQLSEPSRISLRLQGGKMSAQELDAFRVNPHWPAAVELRYWDDMAKVAMLPTPSIEHFLNYVAAAAATEKPCLKSASGTIPLPH
ncbi:MAG TPA: metal-dependent phosphohydrolase [Planctomycetaceae bacterium]|nr:metal-dependent phosphohydrolase [Planctomycetaceae bacterium]